MRPAATIASLTLVAAAFASCASCTSSDSSSPANVTPDASNPQPDGGGDRDATSPTDGGGPDADAMTDAAPAGKLYAFVGSNDGKVRTYDVDSAGVWTFRVESPAGTSPSFLAFDPPRRRIVATDEGA